MDYPPATLKLTNLGYLALTTEAGLKTEVVGDIAGT